MTAPEVETDAAEAPSPWLRRWWGLMDLRIGVVPAPVVVLVVALAGVYVRLGKAPSDIMAAIVFLGVGGFLCAVLG